MLQRHHKRPGFSWKELLVIVAIIAVLFFMVAPQIIRVREAQSLLHSMERLKPLGTASHNFAGIYGGMVTVTDVATPTVTGSQTGIVVVRTRSLAPERA